jgi:hypothetical protein
MKVLDVLRNDLKDTTVGQTISAEVTVEGEDLALSARFGQGDERGVGKVHWRIMENH